MSPSYQDFINAAIAGDLDSVNTLLLEGGFDPAANDNQALICAAQNDHLNIVERLLQIPEVEANVIACDNETLHWTALRFAARNGRFDSVNRLLQIPVVEANATAWNSQVLWAKRYNRLHYDRLRITESLLRRDARNGDDLNIAENLGIVKYLLRIPALEANVQALCEAAENGHLDIVNRLLQIPAVEAYATVGNNEILRTAMFYGHQEIVNRLLDIPAVRAAVLADNVNVSVDLRTLAQNRENSMRELNLHEQGIVNALKNRYPAMSDVTQRHAILQQLRAFLATACENGGTPVTAQPTPAQLQELSAYCQARSQNRTRPTLSDDVALLLKQLDSPPHRALRYLSETANPLMAPEANLVEVIKNGRRASIAENDWELIALLWKLLTDETAERYGDTSLQDCQETFIHTLALLARAHNYDHDQKTDDNLLDKPSCWMGVTRRLIESIPYFAISDKPDTRPLDATYLERRFKDQCITNAETGLKPLINTLPLSTLRDIQQAIQVLIDAEDLTEKQAALLDGLKLPEEVIASFIEECKPYYGELRFAALRDFRYLNQPYSTTENFIRALANNLREFYLMEIHQFVTQELEANSKEEKEEESIEPMIEEPFSTYTPSYKRKRDDEEEENTSELPLQRQRITEETEVTEASNNAEDITVQSWCRIT